MQNEGNDNNQANWSYSNEDESVSSPQSNQTPVQPVSWTASEFIANQKDAKWYSAVLGGAAMLCVLVVLIFHDYIAAVAIFVVVILFVIVAGRKPQQLQYTIDTHGVTVGKKFYSFNDFKSFSVDEESAIGSISFMPLRRFMPELSIHYAPEDEDKIIDVLAVSLPNDQRAEQGVDRLMKRMRF